MSLPVFQRWLESVMPEPVEIAGQRLLPLSCGHVMLLSRLTGWEPLGTDYPMEDIPLGLYACSRPWRDAWRDMGRRSSKRFLARLARKAPALEVAAAWAEYLDKALVLPAVRRTNRPKEAGTRPVPGAPFLLRLRLFAFSELGLGEDGFSDITLADLIWLWLARAEDLGELRFTGEEDQDFVEWAREQDRARMEEAG